MNAKDVVAAIRFGRPGEQFGYGGNGTDLVDLVWSGNEPPPTYDEVVKWDVAAKQMASTPKPPPAADAVLGAIASLDPATASVADVLNAVRAALVKAGATPV